MENYFAFNTGISLLCCRCGAPIGKELSAETIKRFPFCLNCLRDPLVLAAVDQFRTLETTRHAN